MSKVHAPLQVTMEAYGSGIGKVGITSSRLKQLFNQVQYKSSFQIFLILLISS